MSVSTRDGLSAAAAAAHHLGITTFFETTQFQREGDEIEIAISSSDYHMIVWRQ
jgi:hypothetical protein